MGQQSKPSQNQPKKPQTIEQLIQDFCQNLEKGDFGLSKIIKYGYLVYGQTRSGKTAGSHLLSGNALKGVKIAGQAKVQTSTSKNRRAKIGNTPISQTRVPNIFEVKNPKSSQEKACVIDTPGYGDTYGTFRLLGNGYYHYKLYSKVQNMKFILFFDLIQLNNTAELFIDTIVQFTSYFKDYKDQRHQIWRSCVFLINKVDDDVLSFDDIKEKLKSIAGCIKIQKRKQEIDLIKQFINFIVSDNRLFTIKKFKQGESGTRVELLKSIDEKADWWSRQINSKKQEEVDMSKIQFNITKTILVQLTKNELSKQEFVSLINHYNFRINEILDQYKETNQDSCSLDAIFHSLVKDAMGSPDSHNFLEKMKKYVEKYYKIYDINYKEQREKNQKQLFGLDKNISSENTSIIEKGVKIKDKNFIVKKFRFLKNVQVKKFNMHIINKKQQEQGITRQDKSISEKIDQLAKALYSIIKEFNNVAYKRNNCSEIIYKYGYIIYRVISEVQVILLLIGHASGKSQDDKTIASNKILDAADNKVFSLERPLTDFMGLDYNYLGVDNFKYEQLRDRFIKEIDLEKEQFKKIQINWSLIDLFSENESEDPVVVQKVIVLLQKFSEQFLQEKQHKQQNISQTNKLIHRLTIARQNCFQLSELAQTQDRKSQFFFIVRRITQNIGKLLQSIKRYDLARKVYKSVLYVDGVCNLYKNQIEESNHVNYDKSKSTPNSYNKLFRLRIQYGEYLNNHGRQKEGIIVLQQAFELASNKDELLQAKKLLSEALLQQKSQEKSSYEEKLFQNHLFDKFEEELIQQLESLGTNNVSQSQVM